MVASNTNANVTAQLSNLVLCIFALAGLLTAQLLPPSEHLYRPDLIVGYSENMV
jgi:hypothetical protein